jgi:predicted ATPase with chaperone activity
MIKSKVPPSTKIEDKFLNEPIECKSIRIDRRNAWVEYPAQSFLTTSFPALK